MRLRGMLCAVVLVAAACGGGGDNSSSQEPTTDNPSSQTEGYAASIASYEPVAGVEQRFIVGLTGPDGKLVSFGTVSFGFAYLGTRDEPVEAPEVVVETDATFLPIPGQDLAADVDGEPSLVDPSEGTGVYAAYDVEFPEPGFWEVRVAASVDGEDVRVAGAFEVFAEPRLPFPGEPAPRTQNRVWGAGDVDAKALDSRAEPGGDDPAPGLHSTVIADAIDAGRPLLVVVSTPVYCQSRFCGPITDMVQDLSEEYRDRMDFVHLEVYRDFEKNQVNAAAAEWALVEGGPLQEPWTYLVGPDGVIVDRWDNVANESELRAAIDALLV